MNYPKIKIVSPPKVPTTQNEVRVHSSELLMVVAATGRILDGSHEGASGPEPREDGSLKNHGFWLSQTLDWVIVKDEVGSLVLVPLKKKK